MTTKSEKISDHDLLIRLDQKVGDLQVAVKNIADGTVSKIAALEKDKADKDIVEDLQNKLNVDVENRVQSLERANETNSLAKKVLWGMVAIIVTGVLGSILYLVIPHISNVVG